MAALPASAGQAVGSVTPIVLHRTHADESERRWLLRALRLARRGLGKTSPNPAVGAVVVRDGQVVGEGFHARAGAPHAEAVALQQAGSLARGATLYVTLEPCAHWGRTPPCTEAIIQAGIRRVVACTIDPNPIVNGRGFARLMEAGIEVALAEPRLQERARALNEAYEKFITTGLPFVTCKAAVSLDGKTATATGQSRWITKAEARELAHRLRAVHDAVMVGVGTVLADDPILNVRLPGRKLTRQPVRIVVDSLARTPPTAALLHPPGPAGPAVVAVTERADPRRVEALQQAGAEVWRLPADARGRVDLRALMEELGRRSIVSVLVEGGGTLHAGLFEAGLVDRVVVFLAPLVIGGSGAPTFVEGVGCPSLQDAWPVVWRNVRRLPSGELLVEARVDRGQPHRLGVVGS